MWKLLGELAPPSNSVVSVSAFPPFTQRGLTSQAPQHTGPGTDAPWPGPGQERGWSVGLQGMGTHPAPLRGEGREAATLACAPGPPPQLTTPDSTQRPLARQDSGLLPEACRRAGDLSCGKVCEMMWPCRPGPAPLASLASQAGLQLGSFLLPLGPRRCWCFC